jgi:chromatin structure-remodeling complex subunit SFH1
LRNNLNSFLGPVIPPAATQPPPSSRTTKRGTVVINYSEDLLADDDFDESDGPRRATGLRTRQIEPASRDALVEKLSKEITQPVEIQGIWRDWMGKPKFGK